MVRRASGFWRGVRLAQESTIWREGRAFSRRRVRGQVLSVRSRRAIIRLLKMSWPTFVALTPEMAGFEGHAEEGDAALVDCLRMLSLEGLISYEMPPGDSVAVGLVVHVALTPRGRAIFA